ncbi:MAG TPA: AAA family ATPase [Candidatus Saccharimonadaceae bacterium]|nr:AAA family ATPase [Candidatus Saccharimonadaceae bacterium]
MPHTYLINRPSGTGKTSIGDELEKRGYRVINTDKAFGYYANLETRVPVTFPKHGIPNEKWYSTNGWAWDSEKVEKTLKKYSSETVFFCGGSFNESYFYPQFTKIFRLHCSPEKLIERLTKRKGDSHTNNTYFIAKMLDLLETSENDAERLGWPVIDTTNKTIRQSANEIERIIGSN